MTGNVAVVRGGSSNAQAMRLRESATALRRNAEWIESDLLRAQLMLNADALETQALELELADPCRQNLPQPSSLLETNMPLQLSTAFLNSDRKLRNGWWVVLFMALLSALLFPVLLIGIHFGHELTMIEQAAIILVATWICQVLRRRSLLEVTGRPGLQWAKELVLGGAIGAGLMMTPALLLTAGGWISWHLGSLDLSTLAPGLFLMAGVAVAEELLFRGVLFQRLIAGVGVWPAQLLIAGLFLLTHLNNPGMVGTVKILAGANIFLASILFGLVYLRTRSLAMPIGLHFMANVTQGVVLGFGVSGTSQTGLVTPQFNSSATWLTGGSFGLEASLPGLICVVVAVVALIASQRRRERAEVPRAIHA